MKNPFKNSRESETKNTNEKVKDSNNSKGKPKDNSVTYFFKSLYEYGIFSNLTNFILFILILFSGLFLIISALYPPLLERFIIVSEILPAPILQLSHKISFLIGLMLIVISKEIFCKVKRSYYITIALLILGGIFTFIKGLSYEEAIALLIVSIILRLSRKSFYRKSIPIKLSNYTITSVIVIAVTVFLIEYAKTFIHNNLINHRYVHDYYWRIFQFKRYDVLADITTYGIFVLFLVFLYITREKIEDDPIYSEKVDMNRVKEFLSETNNGNSLTHLTYLGDKKVYWALNGEAMIPYAKFNDKIIVLSDPIVPRERLSDCIQEFQKYLDIYGYKASFLQIAEENLSIYHDNGYYFFKLGEEAVVNLETFNLVGSKKSSFRNILRRFEKDGYSFEIIEPPYTKEFLEKIKNISDEWLGGRKEKSFSIGWFNEAYLKKAPIAILKDNNKDEIIAFVSLMYCYDGKSIAIDLMRFRKKVPNSTMEFLFLSIILYFQAKGYKRFNLGEAPLSSVGLTPGSHLLEKFARLLYNYGQVFYSFSGLRRFKQKFKPEWEAKYLAYSSFLSLPDILIDMSVMTSRVPKDVANYIIDSDLDSNNNFKIAKSSEPKEEITIKQNSEIISHSSDNEITNEKPDENKNNEN
ncbi:MAG: phosphatidylglycerol lysyltransferase domain-containing protein [Clostridium perfringens]|nr:phosphatidylglycerol lysyltransferase domain-containing protein [Clostridium perfringens]